MKLESARARVHHSRCHATRWLHRSRWRAKLNRCQTSMTAKVVSIVSAFLTAVAPSTFARFVHSAATLAIRCMAPRDGDGAWNVRPVQSEGQELLLQAGKREQRNPSVTFERRSLRFSPDCGRRKCRSLDLGANNGWMTAYMLQLGSHVVAVEPSVDFAWANAPDRKIELRLGSRGWKS